MPFVNIENSGKGSNKGSCRALVEYLSKENKGKDLIAHEHFFSQLTDCHNRLEVMTTIDSNVRKLSRSDSKFFMLTLNFSEKELQHIKNDSSRIRQYTRSVMDLYAKNFGKGLTSADLVWYGKIEYTRSYKGFEPEVLNGSRKIGEQKPGLNTHVHLIISRKDRQQRFKLSPMTNHRSSSKGIIKSGFNRTAFKIEAEQIFDHAFKYQRAPSDHFVVANTLKNGTSAQRQHVKYALYSNQNALRATLSVARNLSRYYPSEEEEQQKKKRKHYDNEQHY